LKIAAFLGRAFRAREIFIRADGRVRFIRLSPFVQVSVFAAIAAVAIWSAYTTLSMQSRGEIIATQNLHISHIERDRTRLGGELAATRAYYSNAASEITRQYRELRRLAYARGDLESQLMSAQSQLAEVETRYQSTRDVSQSLDHQLVALKERIRHRDAANDLLLTRLAETGSALAGASVGHQNADALRRRKEQELAYLEASLENTESLNQHVRQKLDDQNVAMVEIAESRDLAKTEIRRLSSNVTALNSDLDEAYRSNSSLRRRLAATSDALTETHRHQIEAEQRGNSLTRTVGSLENRLDQVRATQLELLRGIREKAQGNIAALQATLSQTGIELDELINATIRRKSGLGGPLVALGDELTNDGEETFEGMVANLEMELLQWESMQTLMEHLPLSRPTVRGYISSEFGKRRDPINGRRAFHKGVDIAAPTHTPIYATAGGVVTFAGTKTAYGRIVEIDHGFGFVTRYGHLRKILVKTGERVTFHQEIARMGTTGRSTGSHVHYEVLFEGEQIDPVNFFEAGRYVFKVQNTRG
jgi:murein DD-endopeptidase MepM/ murein hydrolase activator NlpD